MLADVAGEGQMLCEMYGWKTPSDTSSPESTVWYAPQVLLWRSSQKLNSNQPGSGWNLSNFHLCFCCAFAPDRGHATEHGTVCPVQLSTTVERNQQVRKMYLEGNGEETFIYWLHDSSRPDNFSFVTIKWCRPKYQNRPKQHLSSSLSEPWCTVAGILKLPLCSVESCVPDAWAAPQSPAALSIPTSSKSNIQLWFTPRLVSGAEVRIHQGFNSCLAHFTPGIPTALPALHVAISSHILTVCLQS